jgi:Protein of unknown function N-terminus (DUF3323)
VLSRLPSRGIPIGRLAAESCGDAHALDDERPVGPVVISAVRAMTSLPFAAEGNAVRIEEELVLDALLQDLSRSA